MKKLLYLESVRGYAAVIVVFSHFAELFYPGLLETNLEINHIRYEHIINKLPINIIFNGNFAVCIFFVLSGYVLSYKYFHSRNIESVYSSAIRRYPRLVLPVFISIIVSHILIKLELFYFNEVQSLTYSIGEERFTFESNLLKVFYSSFIGVFLTNQGLEYNPVLWTMQIEFIGSLLVYLILILLHKLQGYKGRLIAYFLNFVLCLILTFFIHKMIYLVLFMIGTLICDVKANSDFFERVCNKFTMSFLLIVGFYLSSYPYADTEGSIYHFLSLLKIPELFIFSHILGVSLLLIFIIMSEKTQRFLSKKFGLFLGEISFSLYLIHFLILCSFTSYVLLKLNKYMNYNIAFILAFFGSIILMLISSKIYFLYVDNTSIKISNLLYKKITSKRKIKIRNEAESNENTLNDGCVG
jgi:peptidoglycan/LPS O-acetylase OafA/YrhL